MSTYNLLPDLEPSPDVSSLYSHYALVVLVFNNEYIEERTEPVLDSF